MAASTSTHVRDFSLGLRALGCSAATRSRSIGDNRPEWFIAELAAQSPAAASVGIFQDALARGDRPHHRPLPTPAWSSPRTRSRSTRCSGCSDRLPRGRGRDLLRPAGLRDATADPWLLTFAEVRSAGRAYGQDAPGPVRADGRRGRRRTTWRSSATRPAPPGDPKGAMLSHRQPAGDGDDARPRWTRCAPGDEYLSFLPLAWIGEQMTAVALRRSPSGFTVNFPEEPETVQDNLREIGPHVMFAPPAHLGGHADSEVQVRIEDAGWLKRQVCRLVLPVGSGWPTLRSRHRAGAAAACACSTRSPSCLVFGRCEDQLGPARTARRATPAAPPLGSGRLPLLPRPRA